MNMKKNSSPQKEKPQMKKIMVVDDELDILEPIKETLERGGYAVVTASSADDCLKKVQTGEKPDLILMDIIMPGTPVREIIPKLGNIKVVYLSAVRISDGERQEIVKGKNILDFMLKPFELSVLLKKVNSIVG